MRKMKDSGIDWIGMIPYHWTCCKQKYLITLLNGRAYKDDEFEEDGKYKILRVGNLFTNPVWYTSSLELEPNKYCQDGDLLYSWSMSYAPVIWHGEKVIYHYHIWKTLLSEKINKMFAYYYLISLTNALQAEVHETTMGFITMGVMNNAYIAYPTFDEQKKIADFLDDKCGEIDSIRSDIQKQIDILNDYKKSVITEAVTKGLNPKVKLKDSGIEWIGKIPEGWKTSYIKRLFDITLGKMINSEKDAGLENYLCAANIKWTGINVEVHKQMHFSEYEKKLYILNDGDVLVMEGGMAGTAAIYHNEFYPCYIQNSVMRCRSKNVANLQTFLYYWLFAIYHLGYIDRICNRATIQHYTKEKLGNTPILFPPLSEQKAIADYLDEKCSEIDATIADKQKQLETLDEYKKSLIFEYVTGKKECI